jgi:hypothetical protein
MAQISIYYDYFDDKLCPMWMIVKFKSGSFNWTREKLYIPVNTPFERLMCHDFISTELGLTVVQDDLFVSYNKVGCFGISISRVKKRINKMRGEKYAEFFRLEDIEQLVIQVCDIEEIMVLSRDELNGWM